MTTDTRAFYDEDGRFTRCRAGSDGDCVWSACPQLRDGEPAASGRHCPLDLIPDPYTPPEEQFCPACPTDMPQHRDTGRWVEVEGHEHTLPVLRPYVYLSDSTPGAHLYHASLAVYTGNSWLGAKEFPTMGEAMDYARAVLAPMSAARLVNRG